MPYEAKTDWKYDDLVTEKDMNRIEQGLKDAHVPAHQPLTLNPGLQVVEVEQDTPFRMGEVKGRTLMNLSGREGNFDYRTSPLFTFFGTGEIIPASTPVGTKVQKIVCDRAADSPGHFGARYELNIDRSKHYVAVAYLDNISCDEPVYFSLAEWKSTGYYTIRKSGNVKKGKGMQYRYIDISPDRLETQEKLVFYFRGEGTAGAEFRIGAFGIYEISQAEYEAIGKMKFAQVAERYPYVDSMTNVKNPYAIVTGGNLLPPFYEWSPQGVVKVTSPYEAELTPTTNEVTALWCDIPTSPNTDYILSIDQNGATMSVTGGADGAIIVDNTAATSAKFNSGDRNTIRVYVSNFLIGSETPSIGNFTFKNPMLTIGTEPRPFAPQQRSMIAFEAELAAHPVDGSNPDTLLMGDDGLPYVLGAWKKITLDGALDWKLNGTVKSDFKIVTVTGLPPAIKTVPQGIMVDYKGVTLTNDLAGVSGWTSGGCWQMGDAAYNNLYVSISNTDSGWGQDYNPTQDEIKAYFLGWKMYDPSTNLDGTGTYNRSDGLIKAWTPLDSFNGNFYNGVYKGPGVPNEIPSLKNTDVYVKHRSWTPYRLQYLKVKPTVEPVRNYELGATLCAGSNMVEVGSGIVIRERANPVNHAGLYYLVNHINFPASYLQHKAKKIAIYANNAIDSNWTHVDIDAYGLDRVFLEHSYFDPTAVYHVTYTMLDPTIPAPISGTVAANLRGTVSALVRAVSLLESEISISGEVAMTAADVGAAAKDEFDDLKKNAVVKNGDSVIEGMLSMSKNDGPHLQLKGTTSSFGEWYVGNERKGYFGVGDASNPDRVSVVSEKGSLNLYGAQGVNINGIAAYRQAVYLGEGTDLNAVTGEGLYYCPANVTVQTMKNVPLADAFALQVFRHAGVTQVFYNYRSNPGDGNLAAQYKRSYYNNHWTPWYKVADSRDIDDLKQSVVDGKGKVAGAINDMGGGPVSANNTFDELAAAIRANQGASGSTGLTKQFFDNFSGNFSGPTPFDAISGSFHFNKDGNAVGIAVSTKGGNNYDYVLREISPSGVRLSQQTIESGAYMYDTFRGGVGLAKPGKYAYAIRPDSITTTRVRIRNSSGTLVSSVQPPVSVTLPYTFDITEIGGTYYLSSFEWQGGTAFRATIYDSNFNKAFTSTVQETASGNFKGGYFIDPNTALYQLNGSVLCIRWTLANGWQEVQSNYVSDYYYTQLLAAYAYRQ